MLSPLALFRLGRDRLCSALALAVVLPCACVSPASQGVGLLRTSVRGPLFASHEPAPECLASGAASTRTFLALFSHGDASIAQAMRSGGVARVHHADYEYESLLFGLLATYRTIVYGAPADPSDEPSGTRAGMSATVNASFAAGGEGGS